MILTQNWCDQDGAIKAQLAPGQVGGRTGWIVQSGQIAGGRFVPEGDPISFVFHKDACDYLKDTLGLTAVDP